MERRCKNLNKTWSNLKQLAQSRVQWRVGIVDALCQCRYQGNYEEDIDRKFNPSCFIFLKIMWSMSNADLNV